MGNSFTKGYLITMSLFSIPLLLLSILACLFLPPILEERAFAGKPTTLLAMSIYSLPFVVAGSVGLAWLFYKKEWYFWSRVVFALPLVNIILSLRAFS
ncbi:MAG: hypothetical protein QW594_01890 [Candidatus Woesearchaeota archaeon]